VVNPQYGNVWMLDNLGNSTYHSLQLQFTRRLTRGFTNTTTWTWSKAMGDSDTDAGANYRDPTRRSIERTLLGFDRQHQITSKVTKVSNGVVYVDGFTQIVDPGFAVPSVNGLNAGYTNKAIVGLNGQVVLVNPQPGEVGTLGYATLRGPRSFNFDMNLIKRFKIHETVEFEFRLDAINVLNNPNFGNPNTNIK